MMIHRRGLCVILPLIFAFGSCRSVGENTSNWVMYGRTSDDHRFSPLNQINEQTVGGLGLAWSRELGTTRGLEATPLVEDGVIYTTGSWSVVYAIDARTGIIRWTYDPKVPREHSRFLGSDAVNRGVALHRDKIYVGTLDARLVAVNKLSGAPIWSVSTADIGKPYSITGAPRIARKLVIIGNAGSEYGMRGYISAYDAETGKLSWRSYTVPGDPSKGFESKAMEVAAKTWTGEWWKAGGGGAPWEGIVYDPTLDLLYFGTGNATAWYRALRGPGDNLYTAAILAVRARSGELAWHFQTTPADNWDFDATQPLIQAELTIRGRARKVIMQANKNGFFYVLDRITGEFLSGTPFVSGITWASGLNSQTGRPTESSTAFAGFNPVIVSPSPDGAHNWSPMAFNPVTGLVYLAAKSGTTSLHAPNRNWKYNADRDNIGYDASYEGALLAKADSLPAPTGELLAWDPVRQKRAWSAPYPVVEGGGVLATGGNLIFQGRADGTFAAYRATDGTQLWTFDAGTGIMAAPVTFALDGVQYVSVMAGLGGASGLFNFPGWGPIKPGYGRIVTFKLGGSMPLRAPPFGHKTAPVPTLTDNKSPQSVHSGALLFGEYCASCHGMNAVAGALPDLRYASKETLQDFEKIVLGGARISVGMPSFKTLLDSEQVQTIRSYIISRALEAAKPSSSPQRE